MEIIRYTYKHKAEWDQFVTQCKNQHFMFYRDYLEYHQDHFFDHSLMFFVNLKLIAILPGHEDHDRYYSHNGLTYGGFLVDAKMKTSLMLDVLDQTVAYLKKLEFKILYYKTIPYIYHQIPAEEDRYALFRHGAELWRRDVMPVVLPDVRVNFQERRLRGIKKALKSGVKITQTNDLKTYWDILSQVLWEQHQTKPVHSLAEISHLHGLFPENLKLYGAYIKDEMLAGVLCYQTKGVLRSQYIANSPAGRKHNALDLIFSHLLEIADAQHVCFDFGPCNEDNGNFLNVGLIDQKEGFGARVITHDFYKISL